MVVRDVQTGAVTIFEGFSDRVLYRFFHGTQPLDVIDAAWVAANEDYPFPLSQRGLSGQIHCMDIGGVTNQDPHRGALVMANNFSDGGSVVGGDFVGYITIHK